jgi:hypothetical protein
VAELPVLPPEEQDEPVDSGKPKGLLGQKPFYIIEDVLVLEIRPLFPALLIDKPGIGKDPFQAGSAKDPFKEADGMVLNHSPFPPAIQEGFEIIGGGIGGVKLYQGRLNKAYHLSPSFN